MTFAAIMLLFGSSHMQYRRRTTHRLAPTHSAASLQQHAQFYHYYVCDIIRQAQHLSVLSLSDDVEFEGCENNSGLTMWVTVGLRKGCWQANGDKFGSGCICQGAGGRRP